MKQKNVLVTSLLMGCVVNAWALPWLPSPVSKKVSKVYTESASIVDFSGHWQGRCNNQPAADLSIKQQPDSIELSYGFMKEKYQIDAIKLDASSQKHQSDVSSHSVIWNSEKSALIFINTNQFLNSENHLNAFFSKVSMTLNSGQLLISSEYFQSSNTIGVVEKEIISCVYSQI